MTINQTSSNTTGFSLAEILVVIFIIFLVLGLGFNSYQNQREFTRYHDAILKVLELIQTGRHNVLNGQTVLDPLQPEKGNFVPEEGFGIYLNTETSELILFANTARGNTPEEDNLKKNRYDANEDMIEEVYTLDSVVDWVGLFSQISPDLVPIESSQDGLVILFKPPLAAPFLSYNVSENPDSVETWTNLYLAFRRQGADENAPLTYVHINGVSGLTQLFQP